MLQVRQNKHSHEKNIYPQLKNFDSIENCHKKSTVTILPTSRSLEHFEDHVSLENPVDRGKRKLSLCERTLGFLEKGEDGKAKAQ